jgi:hypothetical protein
LDNSGHLHPWFVDHDDGIIQMNNSEAMALKGVVAHSLAYRNGHDVVRPQLGIMSDPRLALYRHRPESEKVFRLFARQPQRQANQIWQELASGSDTKLMVLRHHARFFSGVAIVLDKAGNVYISGATYSPNFPTTAGAFQTTNPGGSDRHAFVSKFSSTGSLIYST